MQQLKVTHSDVPGAFTVGFVVTGEALAGYDARVCDQVASAEEDGPKREKENVVDQFITTGGKGSLLLQL